ncbi:MAG: FAM91 N-terminus-domain-containing protein [Monoraphidium minutum]|nr:MAG: FAM91 N-terminus-domain-containing protein [Monoraphidium minutum]
MAFEEYIRRAIATGRAYDDLPARVKAALPAGEWRAKVREFCIQRGYPWSGSAARNACGQQEYYEDLLARYKAWGRIFPYHLSDYVARVQRASPFKYYSDILFMALKAERSYDSIPNFTAADALRVTGVGRNEYIALLNACKAKRLMWRVNKALARDLLPQVEQEARLEPWWLVEVTNVGETEFRELAPAEADLLRAACDASSAPALVSKFDAGLLRGLHARGLVYFDVPVGPGDRFAIPPLEGFVSNRTADAGDAGSDPIEALLYSAFVASSERLAVADLAGILGVATEELQVALSVACRLGFATRLPPAAGDGGARAPGAASPARGPAAAGAPRLRGVAASAGALSIPEDADSEGEGRGADLGDPSDGSLAPLAGGGGGGAEEGGGGGGGEEGAAIAIVVDSEATSYLMMGALSPGLKRHSVTLFEAGRVSGPDVIAELSRELWASYEAGQARRRAAGRAGFEGDMRQLTDYTAALATLLDAARAAGGGAPLELVRKESLAGLDPAAAAKVLAHSYRAVLPIAPLPGAPLPLPPGGGGPAHYGASAASGSPWLHLALYAAARSGPLSLVLTAGQRLCRLPAQLEHCSHALLWSWDPEPRPGLEGQPVLAEGAFLLASLNDMLTRSAVVAQPLLFSTPVTAWPAPAAAARPAAGGGAEGGGAAAAAPAVDFADVALPLTPLGPAAGGAQAGAGAADGEGSAHGGTVRVAAAARRSGKPIELELPGRLVGALRQLGLEQGAEPKGGGESSGGGGGGGAPWLPLAVQLGVPLYDLRLCKAVCAAAAGADFLSPQRRAAHGAADAALHAALSALAAQYGAGGGGGGGGGARGCASLPAADLLFDGSGLTVLDLSDAQQAAARFAG